MSSAHYDLVHRAWELIMGEDFHYGYFESPQTTLPAATAALTDKMLQRAQIAQGDRVLDVGCGTGRQACDLAVDVGASVLGITTSSSGVAAARALAADLGAQGAEGALDARFDQRDGTDNGLPDESFDVVWVLESSHLMRDRRALLKECARVLAPKGRLVLCDIVRKRDIPFLEVRQRRAEFATLRAAFGDAHMEPLADYVATLTQLGLTVTESIDISAATLPTFAAWRANLERYEGAVRELIGQRGVDDFTAATLILEGLWRDGTLGYGILAAAK